MLFCVSSLHLILHISSTCFCTFKTTVSLQCCCLTPYSYMIDLFSLSSFVLGKKLSKSESTCSWPAITLVLFYCFDFFLDVDLFILFPNKSGSDFISFSVLSLYCSKMSFLCQICVLQKFERSLFRNIFCKTLLAQ